MIGEVKGSLYVPFKGAPKTFFQGALKIVQKCEEKYIFDVVIDGLLDSSIEGALEGAPRDAINNLYKDAQEVTVTCECKQNFVNILNFKLLLFIFNFSKMQVCGLKGEESKLQHSMGTGSKEGHVTISTTFKGIE